MANKYGLSRDIPESVKLRIRQHAGFGCVICGLGIVEYEHVDPEFKDAKVHDPEKMTLLCPICHTKATSGLFSKDRVKEAMEDPVCKRKGIVVVNMTLCACHR